MSKTRHIHKRLNQRGISESLLDVIADFGVSEGDKLILNRKGTLDVLKQLDALRKKLLEIQKKGGLVVVEAGESLLTTYRLDSYQR